MGEGLGMDVRGRVKTEGFIKPLALRDGCKGGVKGLSSRAEVRV